MIPFLRTALLSLVALAAGCSGNVVVDSSTDTMGAGGGGGSITGTTTGSITGTTGTTPTGTTGTTTTGTTTGTTTNTVAGNCSGAMDFGILANKPVWTMLVQCVIENGGGEPGLLMCIDEKTALSSGCVKCCDAYVGCAIQFCLSPCVDGPNGASCVDCRKQNCDGSFMACSGVPFVPHP